MADNSEKICFVIAPIGEPGSDTRTRSDQVLEHIIRPVVESCGYKAVRADEIAEPGMIPTQIIRHVVQDPLVIADLTGQNANVFYELAIRHYTGKPLVQIINNVEDIPFDVGSMRTIVVNHQDLDSVKKAKTEIQKQIQHLEANPSSLESPISVALANRAIDEIRQPRIATLVVIFLIFCIAVVGYISFEQFRKYENAQYAERLVDEIKKNRDKFTENIQALTAETIADDPEEAKQADVNVGENPMAASLIDKASAQAVFLQQQGKKDEAIEKWLAVALAEESDNDQAARAWFSVGYLRDNLEDRISAYDRAISLKPDFVEAYNNRGVAKAKLEQYGDAIVDYDEAIRLKSDFFEAYYNRGIAKAELDRYDEARTDFIEAIRLRPDYAKAYRNRGAEKGKLDRYEGRLYPREPLH